MNPLLHRLTIPGLLIAMLFVAGCRQPVATAPAPETDAPAAKAPVPPAKPASADASKKSDDDCDCRAAPTVAAVKKPTPAIVRPSAVELKVVKLDGLTKAIATARGKVVVVDVWATFCAPCQESFPHLVALQDKYAAAGLECFSVSVDEPEAHEAAMKFLRKQNATLANYLLDEDTASWQEHWNLKAIPAVFVFQAGKQVARFDHDDPAHRFTYADVEKKVGALLQAK